MIFRLSYQHTLYYCDILLCKYDIAMFEFETQTRDSQIVNKKNAALNY